MRIFILESIRKSEPNLGELVHKYLDQENISNDYFRFQSKQELLKLLDIIKIKASSENFQPFVHLVCHGNDSGIAAINQTLGSEDLILWEEVRQSFREIYLSSKQKSIICMSSCEGFHISKLVAHCQPCPYDHVCGSFEKISFKDAYYAYVKFYKLIKDGSSVFEAAVEVHKDPQFKDMKFIAVNSPTLFKIAIDGYIEKECTEERLNQKKELYGKYFETIAPLNKNQKDYLEKAFSIEGQRIILQNCADTFFS